MTTQSITELPQSTGSLSTPIPPAFAPRIVAPPCRAPARRRCVLLNHHHLILGLLRCRRHIVPDHPTAAAVRPVARRRLRDPHAGHHGRHDGHLHRPSAARPRSLRRAHLEHFRFSTAAAPAALPVSPPASLVLPVVVVVVLHDHGARLARRRGPGQEDGRPAGARVQQREEQQEAADGAEHDAGDDARRGGRVLPAVGGRDSLKAGAALRRARGDGIGLCEDGCDRSGGWERWW